MPLNDADKPTIQASLTAAKAETERIKAAIATLGAAVDKINAEDCPHYRSVCKNCTTRFDYGEPTYKLGCLMMESFLFYYLNSRTKRYSTWH